MDLINGLVAEAAMSSIPASSSSSAAHVPAAPTESLKPSDADQTLLLIGFNDWDTLLSNNPTGLEQYHRVSIPTPVKKVFTSSTSFHFFVLGKDGSLFVMGKNDHGQLGTGDLISQKAPLKLPTGELDSPVVKVATGRSHTLVLLENGRVFGCGSNSFGQLGLGDNKTAVRDFLKLTALPLENVVDISAGENFSMACTRGGKLLVFGHPEYGQLGLGTTGQYIKDGGKKGAAIQYHFVTRPQQIQNFFSKDAHGKVTEVITADNIRIRKVAAGKNHAMCLEDWENGGQNRLFAWGFGGYGRLGHNGSSDELVPREVSYFNQSAAIKLNPQKYLRSIEACSSFSLAVSETKALYFWGKLSNSPRGEATMYPKIVQELCGFTVNGSSGTSNGVFVIADENMVAWGVPVSGKFGLEGGVKSSTVPKFVTDLNPFKPTQVACGYGHICVLVEDSADVKDKLNQLPIIASAPATASAAESTEKGKKRGDAGKDTSQTKKAKK